jgi:hypothetical protein
MTTRSFVIAGAIALAAVAGLAGLAHAQSFSAAPGQTFHVDLDTVDGHFSHWGHKDIAAISAARATISIDRMGSDPKWKPYFRVALDAAAPGQNATAYGLRFRTNQGRPPILLETYYRDAQNKDVVVTTFKKTLAVKEKISVELFWKANTLTVRVGNSESSNIVLPGPVSALYISSSTGELKGDVSLGTALP